MPETTENQKPVGAGEPGATTSETPPAGGEPGTPAAGEPNYKELYLKETKPALEEKNRLRQENANLRARQQPSPAAVDDRTSARAQRQETVRHLAHAVNDPLAQELLDVTSELRGELSRTVEGIAQLRRLDAISDPQEREETLVHFERNSHRLGDIDAAYAEVRQKKDAEDLKVERARANKLAEDLKRLQKSPDPSVARTATREVSAQEHEFRTMKTKDYDQEIARLNRENTTESHRKKMELQNQYANGDLNLED